MWYGEYVASAPIDLTQKLSDLGIDKGGSGLLPIEKIATIRDLLMSSSGVDWRQEILGVTRNTSRGSKKPGSYFHYNNRDFKG